MWEIIMLRELHVIKALVKKDLLFEPVFRFLVPYFCISYCAALLWGALESHPAWPLPHERWGLSTASQLFIPFVLFSPVFLSYIFMEVIRREKQHTSFIYLRAFPISPRGLFWGRVFSCWVISMVCIFPVYVLFLVLHVADLVTRELLAPLVLGIRFPIFLIAVAFFVSTVLVGLAMNVSPQLLPVIAVVVGTVVVLMPFLFSELIMGTEFEFLLFKLVRAVGTIFRASAALFILSLLLGGMFSQFFSRKRSYV